MDRSTSSPKDHCFNVRLPADASVDMLTTGLITVAGPDQVGGVQHRGGTLFLCSVNTRAELEKIIFQRGVEVQGRILSIELLGSRTVSVACYMVPLYVLDEELIQDLNRYGKVHSVRHVMHHEERAKGIIRTRTRIVKMEIHDSSPVRNYIRLRKPLVTCECPGVKHVCRRCKQEGYLKAACKAPFRKRCSILGYEEAQCTSKCRHGKGNHATVDCTRPRSYAAVTSPVDFPELPRIRPDSVVPDPEGLILITRGCKATLIRT